jgi:hypothetical protein
MQAQPQLTSLTNPRWANAAKTAIDCVIDHPEYGSIPFTASPSDPEPHGQAIYSEISAGDHGPIADYVPPPSEFFEAPARAERNRLLAESDWTDLPSAQARLTDAQKEAWTAYRQALRDITNQPGFPASIQWPTKP